MTFDTVTMAPYEPHLIDYSLLTRDQVSIPRLLVDLHCKSGEKLLVFCLKWEQLNLILLVSGF